MLIIHIFCKQICNYYTNIPHAQNQHSLVNALVLCFSLKLWHIMFYEVLPSNNVTLFSIYKISFSMTKY